MVSFSPFFFSPPAIATATCHVFIPGTTQQQPVECSTDDECELVDKNDSFALPPIMPALASPPISPAASSSLGPKDAALKGLGRKTQSPQLALLLPFVPRLVSKWYRGAIQQQTGPTIVSNNSEIYRFMCVPRVLLTMVPRNASYLYYSGRENNPRFTSMLDSKRVYITGQSGI